MRSITKFNIRSGMRALCLGSMLIGGNISVAFAEVIDESEVVKLYKQSDTLTVDTAQTGISQPTGIAINKDGTLAYIMDGNANKVTVCDVSGKTLTGCIENTMTKKNSDELAGDIALNSSGTVAYISIPPYIKSCNVVDKKVDGCSYTEVDSNKYYPLGYIGQITLNSSGTVGYFANYVEAAVNTCSVNGKSISSCGKQGAGGSMPYGVALTSNDKTAFVINSGENISGCTVGGGKLSNCKATVGVTKSANFIIVDHDDSFAYITNMASLGGSIMSCKVNKGADGKTPDGTLSACQDSGATFSNAYSFNPYDIALNQDGSVAFVTNPASNNVISCDVNKVDGKLSNCR